ncbi:MAG: hypothetical protein HYX27_26720 [Acidobacteria bacterium]|nr:hypothetical protein [Acidobacteriota bacterium]
MRQLFLAAFAVIALFAQPAAKKKAAFPPPIVPKAEELARLRMKVEELEGILRAIALKKADSDLITDVEVYAKAGRFLLEFPQTFFTQDGVNQSFTVLDEGLARGRQLQNGKAEWAAPKGRKILAYRSALDGSVQPYGLTFPDSYDGSKPARLYVWLHGRNQTLTEANFIVTFPKPNKALTYAAEDVGQIVLDCYGRWNNANHWAGEVDIFEAIADVSRRYKIDRNRIILRGFSLGGAGAWHVALQYPDRFAAAEIGAGTYPRRASMGGFPLYQQGPLRIWENIIDWSLNAFNIPIAGHDGDTDPQVAAIPPEPGRPSRGQLESSLRVRAQLAKEGFPPEGEPNNWRVKGTPSIFLISENTGHSISPLVRRRIDGFLKQYGDRGIVSPDEVRFVTYTTRYNRAHWVSVNGMEKHYERADVTARRTGERYDVATRNVTHLTLREMTKAKTIHIDGQALKVKSASEIHLAKNGSRWKVSGPVLPGLRKTHALQGPIDDAFLDPFLLVRPTGTPWNKEANDQAVRILARFDRVYARYYRAHPRIKDDTDVTPEDFARYNVALFGDPGSNRHIAKILAKLPVKWNRQSIAAGTQTFAAAEHVPAMIYPNPLRPGKYVVINSGLTIDEREYHGDYSMPKLGDLAILKVQPGTETPDIAFAALFDERWRLP